MFFVLLLSCSRSVSPPVVPETWALNEVSEGQGLSGLGRAPDGGLWAVSERIGEIVRLDTEGRIELVGVPEGSETEALTWLGADRIALGTESSDAERLSDTVLIARVEDSRAVVSEQFELPFSVLGVAPESNRGLEALCVDDGRLVAVSELIVLDAGARWSPFAIRAVEGGPWTAGRLRLTTETGKTAGLDCEGGQAWSIERHYGVARVLRWTIPAKGGDVVPEIAVAVDELVTGTLPNLEGLAVSAGKIELVTDNDHGGKTGPSWLFEIPRE